MAAESMTLRPYQAKAIAEVNEAFMAGHKRVLLVCPTGGGKTTMFGQIAEDEPGLTMVVAHRRELIRQAISRLPGARSYPSAFPGRVSVGSIQTVGRRVADLPRFNKLIIDEAHHSIAGQYRALVDDQTQADVLGVTATPERLDGRGLGGLYSHMVLGPAISELITGGYLSESRVFGPAAPPDVRALHTLAGDYKPSEVASVMDTPKIIGDAVEHYGWHTPGQPAIVFCASVRAAENTAAAFCRAGWRAVALHGGTDEGVRDAVLRKGGKLETGDIELVCACSLIDEGLDIPVVACVIDLAPTQSLTKVMQRWGRGMRPAAGKRRMTLLDHAGNCLRHGLPDMDREWSLQGVNRRGKAAPATRQCPECFAIHRPSPKCPACGYDYAEGQAAASRREAQRIEGELARLTPDDRRLRHLRNTPLKELLAGADRDRLQEIADARGYKPGWVMQQMQFRRQVRHKPTNGMEFFT